MQKIDPKSVSITDLHFDKELDSSLCFNSLCSSSSGHPQVASTRVLNPCHIVVGRDRVVNIFNAFTDVTFNFVSSQVINKNCILRFYRKLRTHAV